MKANFFHSHCGATRKPSKVVTYVLFHMLVLTGTKMTLKANYMIQKSLHDVVQLS